MGRPLGRKDGQRLITICGLCGKKVETSSSARKFCSRKCFEISHRTAKTSTNCKQCGKKFSLIVFSSLGERIARKRTFCSRKCSALWTAPQHPHTYWLGKKRSQETCQKMSQSLKGRKSWLKGKKGYTNNGSYKVGHIGMAGEDNPAWKDGMVAKENHWRKAVFERDDYTCQLCGEKGNYLNAHHIKEQSLYPNLRFDLDNGQTLCRPCHQRLHIEKGIINWHPTTTQELISNT